MKRRGAIAGALAFSLLGTAILAHAAPAKLVYYGWGTPAASYVATHAASMEEMPFDGTAIAIPIDRAAWEAGRRDTSNQLGWATFGARRFTTADFADTIAELRGVRWTKFTENFLPAIINNEAQGRDFSWFDDARWQTIVQNWVVLLEIARETGCRGLIFDPEDYGGRMFDHTSMAARHPGSFAEYQTKVRDRGRQLMQAGSKVFPGLVMLGLFGPSLPMNIPDDTELAKNQYGLVAAFIDGLVQGADPAFRFIDGGEFAYGLRYPKQFAALRKQMVERATPRSILSEADRKRIEIGFGLWIDNGGPRHWNAEQPWRNSFTPSGFEDALEAALRATDGYVWIYSEAPRFFPPSKLPRDYIDAIDRARRAVAAGK